ncbi:hypothetical protein WOLCODRAFT_20010 [Wolfiporia cocos MD-104 SS10]|uniref:F-box domain-containing protein n=1 Tax=Wolfiporia cocos (strain MD-104) TaxID=742152 RepID=A0A2H3IZW4_WOLCO|nr:hypothetical protein WOLCODRAFT_20010 [Wolfiporia cocos MD-104 SS10]
MEAKRNSPRFPHRALEVVDILYEVFQHIPASERRNRNTLARAARVCRLFSEVALSALWRDINDPIPLFTLISALKLAPEAEQPSPWELDPSPIVFSLCGEITAHDQSRFQYYASRVQKATMQYSTYIDPSLLARLSSACNGKPLLPALRELRWTQCGAVDDGLKFLVSDNLQSLSIELKYPDRLQIAGDYCAFEEHMLAILGKCPSLRRISLLGLPWDRLPTMTAYSWRNLRVLRHASPVVLNTELLSIIAEAIHLTELSISLKDDDEELCESFCCPMLRVVSLRGPSVQLSRFLTSLQLPQLVDLQVEAFGDGKDAPSLLEAIATIPSANLCNIEIWHLPGARSFGSVSNCSFHSSFLKMRQLQRLVMRIERCCGIEMTDEVIELMAQAWPNIQEVLISCAPGFTHPSTRALVCFTRHCPHLKKLSLPYMRNHLSSTADVEEHVLETPHPLSLLSFVGTPIAASISDPAPTAAFLDRIFPNLDAVASLKDFGRGVDPPAPAEWQAVFQRLTSWRQQKETHFLPSMHTL